MPEVDQRRWVDFLEEEDLGFVKRFVLFSGSLKDLAAAYNVSYPTLRLRLDRLIEKIKILDDQRIEDPYERLLRAQFADGKLAPVTFRQLLAAYQQQNKNKK